MYVSAWRIVPVEDMHSDVWAGKLEMSYRAPDPMDELADMLPPAGDTAVNQNLLENRQICFGCSRPVFGMEVRIDRLRHLPRHN